jgi:hypothetical protein
MVQRKWCSTIHRVRAVHPCSCLHLYAYWREHEASLPLSLSASPLTHSSLPKLPRENPPSRYRSPSLAIDMENTVVRASTALVPIAALPTMAAGALTAPVRAVTLPATSVSGSTTAALPAMVAAHRSLPARWPGSLGPRPCCFSAHHVGRCIGRFSASRPYQCPWEAADGGGGCPCWRNYALEENNNRLICIFRIVHNKFNAMLKLCQSETLI